jgi:hypothetical protein
MARGIPFSVAGEKRTYFARQGEMPMATTEEQLVTLATQMATLTLVVRTAFSIVNQDVPNFKQRALTTLRNGVTGRPAAFSDLDAQVTAAIASKFFSDLKDA